MAERTVGETIAILDRHKDDPDAEFQSALDDAVTILKLIVYP